MVDEPGLTSYGGLEHVERRDGVDHPAPSVGPLIGSHDQAADDRATLAYMCDKRAERLKKLELIEDAENFIRDFGGPVGVVDIPTFEDHPVYTLNPTDFFERVMKNVYDDALVLCLKKHKDYGPKNISLSPGGPLNGLRVRMWDKVARANHLIDSGATPENESLRDTYVDILNYAAIAIMVLDNSWPEA